MTLDLDAVLCDSKLHDLFGKACSASATQVWVLEIKRGGSSHVSFLNGRSLPCTTMNSPFFCRHLMTAIGR